MEEDKIKEILDEQNQQMQQQQQQQMQQQQKRTFWNNKRTVKGKALSAWLIVIIAIFMLFVFGLGIYLGKELFAEKNTKSSKNSSNSNTVVDNSNNENNNSTADTIEIKDIKEELLNGTYNDKNISIEIEKGTYDYADGSHQDYTIIKSLSINSKVILESEPFKEIGKIYKISDDYLVTTHGTDINTTKYHLYDKNGSLVQTIYELEENNMVIADSDQLGEVKIVGNTIELYGTRLTHGPSLRKGTGEYYLCDESQLKKAEVDDNYVVEAKYLLTFNSTKFDIKRIEGTEKTLGSNKVYC